MYVRTHTMTVSALLCVQWVDSCFQSSQVRIVQYIRTLAHMALHMHSRKYHVWYYTGTYEHILITHVCIRTYVIRTHAGYIRKYIPYKCIFISYSYPSMPKNVVSTMPFSLDVV